MTIQRLYEIYLRHPSVQTDTRQLKKGDIFFALKGPSFNGNEFAGRALELGAAYAVIDEAPGHLMADNLIPPYISDHLIVVNDVLQTLQDLALYHRRQLDIPFIAITGSNGKTTTKELVHAVLSSAYITYTTKGNLNNHIGIPLTLLAVRQDAQFAVIEMGANHQQEIAGYCRYTLPTHGLITNVGKAHLEGFGGPEGVKKGKGELFDFLRSKDVPVAGGTAFVFHDSADLRHMSRGIPHVVTYGTHDADITGTIVVNSGGAANAPNPGTFLSVTITRGLISGTGPASPPATIHTQLVGDYNLPNVLAAVAVGKHFGVSDNAIKTSIEAYTPSNSRSQMIERDGNHIILDAYNANPSSMTSAIENFARMPIANTTSSIGPGNDSGRPGAPGNSGVPDSSSGGFNRKVLILGAMAELGPESMNEHRVIVDIIGRYPWRQVALVGGDFLRIDHPYLSFPDSHAAGEWLRGAGLKNAYLLVKGSRSMKMEVAVGG